MLNTKGEVIYVGKAKNLKKRISSYFKKQQSDRKTAHLVANIADFHVTVTRDEKEALLLEHALIQKIKPRYNILFRDDKSYPYIFLQNHDFPRLTIYRGEPHQQGYFYGPYPNVRAVRDSLDIFQKIFKLRNCNNSYFKNRSRPCLQYQINRCSAPCVGFIDKDAYQKDVSYLQDLLEGRTTAVIHQLEAEMQLASQNQEFEKAAVLRDQIADLRILQNKQIIKAHQQDKANIDVLGIANYQSKVCIHKLIIRGGQLLGSHQYFPIGNKEVMETESDIVILFIMQHYLHITHVEALPSELVLPLRIEASHMITQLFEEQLQHPIKLSMQVKKQKAKWLAMANLSAKEGLSAKFAHRHPSEGLLELQQALEMSEGINTVVCFDISHTYGKETIGACVLYQGSHFDKQNYRRFNIARANGDDYYAMKETVQRYFMQVKKRHDNLNWIVLIDGGLGQLKQMEEIAKQLELAELIMLSIAKGPRRKSGLETLYKAGSKKPISIHHYPKAFLLLQNIRDEAHRFAITGHRKQRAKKQLTSILESIPGVGQQKRAALLRYFAGLQGVRQANIEQLCEVPGISEVIAKRIYDALHGS